MELMMFVSGMLTGVILMYYICRSKFIISKVGTLKIDQSNPEKDLYRMEIYSSMDDIPKKKYIVLDIELSRSEQSL